MKRQIIHIIIIGFLCCADATAQHIVSGTIGDGRKPLAGVNVFLLGTIDGCMTDSVGRFSFVTQTTGEATLRATCIGFDDYSICTDVTQMTSMTITMSERAMAIDEVVVSASSFRFGRSDNFKTMDALDVVMAGNSCGDLVAALQTLPGTQKVGEDGKLYVRGGDSDECQTFINGMHVLVPYTTMVENSAVRGRFSPFLFKGINFSLGGYGAEYGQALSSVLPMETTDVATSDKLGVSTSLVDWNIGGSKAFSNSSLSFNAAYTDLSIYNEMLPDRNEWNRPYRSFAAETQYKAELNPWTVWKSYAGYDLTSFGISTDGRDLSLGEHNVYANSTTRMSLRGGWSGFVGAACSAVFKNIDGAMAQGDEYNNRRSEIHLKATISKVLSRKLKLTAGMEDMQRSSRMEYRLIPAGTSSEYNLNYNIMAAFAEMQYRLLPRLYLNTSLRAERLSQGSGWNIMPRATLSYVKSKDFQLSIMAGRYSQTPDDDYLAARGKHIWQSTADHAVASMSWKHGCTSLRIEPYYKWYRRLPLLDTSTEHLYTPTGKGYSRGVDIYVEHTPPVKGLTTTFAYSYNDSRRRYLDYTDMRRPGYTSQHNIRLTAKYSVGKVIFGIADSYATGREYEGRTTPYYNSCDINMTWLAAPRVIVYTSVSNVLGRDNVFRYDNGHPVTASRLRFFYIGIFISLKNNKAYEISNF